MYTYIYNTYLYNIIGIQIGIPIMYNRKQTDVRWVQNQLENYWNFKLNFIL